MILQPTPTPRAPEAIPQLPDATPEGRALVEALSGEDAAGRTAARIAFAATPDVSALLEGLGTGCSGELADRAAVLAELAGLRSDEGHALAVPLLEHALGAPGDCAARSLGAVLSLVTATALDGGAATRLVLAALPTLPPGDPRAVVLVDLLDRVAPEGSGWPDRFEAQAGDATLHPWARGAACRAVIQRRVAPSRLLAERTDLPGPVQRCLLLPFAEQRIPSARALLDAGDVDVRMDALSVLREFGEPEDVPALLARLAQAKSQRERRSLVETAGYLVQLHPERAEGLLGPAPDADSPAGWVHARFVAGEALPEAPWEDACDVTAGEGSLQDALDRTAAVGAGGRLCVNGPLAGDGVGAEDLTVLGLPSGRLAGALTLASGVVVGLEEAGVRDGAAVLRLGEGTRLPAAGVRLWQGVDGAAETRGPLQTEGRWLRATALAPASATARLGQEPERPPRALDVPNLPLPPLRPARSAGDGPWVPAVGTGEYGVRVPLRAGDWLHHGDSVLVLSGYAAQP